MSLLALATHLAVAVLVLGSSAVFVWFLMDAGTVLRGEEGSRDGGRPRGGNGTEDPRGRRARERGSGAGHPPEQQGPPGAPSSG